MPARFNSVTLEVDAAADDQAVRKSQMESAIAAGGGAGATMTRTSTDSLLIAGSGSKTLTYAAALSLGWLVGTRLRFANSGSNYMEGAVTAVSSTSVTITADLAVGSGTFTSWAIGIAGDRGTAGVAGNDGNDGATGPAGPPADLEAMIPIALIFG